MHSSNLVFTMPAKTKSVKRARTAVVHKSYGAHVGQPGRADLKKLAVCNNINGPLPGARLANDDAEVTCGRCRRIVSA